MWWLLLASVLLLTLLAFVPGFLIGIAFKHRSVVHSLSLAPALSLALYTAIGVLLGAVGVYGSIATTLMVVVPCSIALVVFMVSRHRGTSTTLSAARSGLRAGCAPLLLFLGVSILVTTAFFLKNLDGPASYSQQSDNVAHLNAIIETAGDGNYSILNTASYSLMSMANGSAPFVGTGFYPNGFYVLASFAVSFLGVNAPLAENATIFVFAGVIYPLTSAGLMHELFGNQRKSLLAGALATAAFAAFPLALLTFGPLYPNMSAFCCVPAVVLSFKLIFGAMSSTQRSVNLALFLFCCLGVASLQPNAIFTAGVILIPFCCHVAYTCARKHFKSKPRSAISVAVFLVFVAVIWVFMVYSPIMRGVTSFDWAAIDNPVSGIYNVLTLTLRLRAPQILLAALVVIGLIRLLADNELRWIAYSYLLMATLYYVGNSFDGELKHLATGFWYTDQWRTAAGVAIIGAPVAAMGISCILDWIRSLCSQWNKSSSRTGFVASASLVLALLAVIIYQPQRYIGTEDADSAFGAISTSLESLNHLGSLNGTNLYTEEERDFATKAAGLIPEGSLVINMPADGSVFACLDGTLNTYYRTTLRDGETDESKLIRLHLDELDDNAEVQNAIKSTGATYVLLLERNGFDDQGDNQWSLCLSYKKSDWEGMSTSKLDEVKSLELLLQEGNMRLYRINL